MPVLAQTYEEASHGILAAHAPKSIVWEGGSQRQVENQFLRGGTHVADATSQCLPHDLTSLRERT